MEANEFEKKIQSTMDEFVLIPNDAVWENVASEIAVEKRKRRIIFWLFSSVMLLTVVGGSLWLRNDKEIITIVNDQAATKVNSTIVSKKSVTKKPINVNDNSLIAASTTLLKQNSMIKEAKGITKNIFAKSKEIHFTKRPFYNNENNEKSIEKRVIINENKQPESSLQQSKKYENSKPLISMVNKGFDNSSIALGKEIESKLKQIIKAKDTESADSISKNKEAKIISVSSNKDYKKQDKKDEAKWKFGFSLFGGYANNISSLPFIHKNEADVQLSNFSLSGNASNDNRSLLYSGGLSYGLEAFFQTPLNNRVSISLGAGYHLYTAKSMVGSRVQNQLNGFDSLLLINYSASEYYTAGQSNHFTNRYHLIEFPLQLTYQLGHIKESKVALTGGITPGMLIGSAALYGNRNSGVYYEEKEQFTKFQLGTQIGLLFTLKSTEKYRLQIEPVAQYSFSNLTKSIISANQHLFFTGIKTTFILK